MNWLIFILLYYIFSVLYFVVFQRPLFILINRKYNPAGAIGKSDLGKIFGYGLKTDVMAAVYLSAIPLILVFLMALLHWSGAVTVIRIYNCVIAFVLGVVAGSDILLYSFWQSKFEASALRYLRSWKGATASVSTLYVVGFILFALLCGAVFLIGADALTHLLEGMGTRFPEPEGLVRYLVVPLCFIVLAGLMFLLLRGTGHHPKTTATSFFSPNTFYNHSALNPFYNFIFSTSYSENLKKKFHVRSDEECESKFRDLYPTYGTPQIKLLNTKRPNILLVIWESLNANFVEYLGGQRKDILPNFNSLIPEGVIFSRCDAGNIRTNRGIVCVLSGYHNPPKMEVVHYRNKLKNLPSIVKTLKKEGYTSEFYHGGDLNLNLKINYYVSIGFDKLYGIEHFPPGLPQSKWGVHDGYVYDDILENIKSKQPKDEPWFIAMQTLSSHEDYKVPETIIEGDDIANAFAYSDAAYGRFIEELKKTPQWDNLLVITLGDHGFYHTPGLPRDKYPHIPVLLLGGAVDGHKDIGTIMNQTDVAATILGQLGIDHSDFIFSRDVLADTYTEPFTFHTHDTGFMLRDANGVLEFDTTANISVAGSDPARLEKGQVVLQQLFTDLDKL